MTELDTAARQAREANIKGDWSAGLSEWWDDQPRMLRTVITILGGGVIAAAISWEGNSSGQGWMRIAEGTAWPVFCWVFGFCCTLGYIVTHRITSEAIRDKQKLAVPIVATVAFALLSLAGVVANQVERAEIRNVVSTDTGTARGDQIAKVRQLQSKVDAFDEATMRGILSADERALAANLSMARGNGMANLDAAKPEDAGPDYPGPACEADLMMWQRQLCNEANGAGGLRASIDITKAAIESNEATKEALELAKQSLSTLKAERTSNFWRGMAQIVPGEETDMEVKTAKVSAFGSLIISIVILFGTAFIIDVVLEYRERRQEKRV